MKNRSNIASSILLNPDLLENVYTKAQDSANSAQEELDKYMESIEGHLKQFRNQLQALYASLIESGTINKVIDLGTDFLKLLTDIVDKLGPNGVLGIVGALGGLVAKNKLFGNDKSNGGLVGGIKDAIDLVKNFNGKDLFSSLFGDAGEAAETVTDVVETVAGAVDDVDDELDGMSHLFAIFDDGTELVSSVGEAAENAAGGIEALAGGTELASGAFTSLGAALKTVWPILVAVAAVYAAKKAWDAFTTTVEEAEQAVADTEGRIEGLKGQIEELSKIDNRSQEQDERLEKLREELDLEERILEVEKQRAVGEKYGTKFEDYFDPDNALNQLNKDRQARVSANRVQTFGESLHFGAEMSDRSKYLFTRNVSSATEWNAQNQKEAIEKLQNEIEQYNEEIRRIDSNLSNPELTSDKTIEKLKKDRLKAIDSRKNAEQKLADQREEAMLKLRDAYAESADYEEKLKAAQEALASGDLVAGSSAYKNAQFMVQEYQKFIDEDEEAIRKLEILLGMRKGMSLDQKIENNNSHIADFSDSRREEDLKILSDYTKDFDDEQKQAWLDATEGARGATEAIKLYEASLGIATEKTSTAFSNATFSEQVNELDALQSAYEKFVSNVNDEDATKINLDISDVEALREKFGEINGFDFDDFEITVTSDTSGVDDIQKAFDEALTAYANTKIELNGISEETENMVRTQLEMEGATKESAEAFTEFYMAINNAEEAEAELISLTTTATQAGSDLSNVTAQEIAELEAEGQVAPVTAQALAALALEKQLAAGVTFGEQGNIDQIIALAEAAGVGAKYLSMLASAKALAAQIDAGDHSATALQNLASLKKEIENFKAEDVKVDMKFDFSNTGGGKSAAGSAGKEAGDAYVDAYEKEVEKLDKLRDQGLISEGQYLSQLKALIDKFFKGRAEYAEKYAEEMKKYLDGMKSYYDSAISGVTTLLDRKISSAQKSKDAAIKAIEAEKDAALAGYQAQIDAIDAIIKEKNKEIKQIEKQKKELEKQKKAIQANIDSIQDEIAAIQKANEERERQIDLQKNLYELERAQNQRTQFIYKGGQMVYQADPEAIRDARENVKQSEDEIKIAALEKQIEAYEAQIEAIEREEELLDEQIDLINEQIEALEEEKEGIQEIMDQVEKFYEDLIAQTEEYWDSIIEALEEQKSKWEELQEIETIAKSFAAVEEVFGELGYTVDDVLNGNEAAFEDFKNKYLQVLTEMNSGNQPFLDGLEYATGEIDTKFGQMGDDIAGSLDQTKDTLSGIADTVEPLSSAADSVSTLGSASETASGGMSGLSSAASTAAGSVSELKESSEGIAENLDGLDDALGSINNVTFETVIGQLEQLRAKLAEIKAAVGLTSTGSNGEQSIGGLGSISGALQELNSVEFSTLIGQFDLLEQKISGIATLLGSGGASAENAQTVTSGLVSAINALNQIKLDEGIIAQFNNLLGVINSVAAAIGGGGGGDATSGLTDSSASMTATNSGDSTGQSGGGAGSITSAIDDLKAKADSVIGTEAGGEDGGDGEEGGTVISDFTALKTEVGNVATAIGTVESEADSGDLIGSIVSLGEKDKEILRGGDSGEGVISDWEAFNEQLSEAEGHITAMADGLENLEDSYETELTVHLVIEGGAEFTGTAHKGNGKGHYTINVLEAIGLPGSSWSGENKLTRGNFKGTAKLKGTANLGGNWAYEGGSTLIGEIGPELVVFPDGHFETFDYPQMVTLPKGSVIFNHLQTADILNPGNQVTSMSGKANLNGTIQSGLGSFGGAFDNYYKLTQGIMLDTNTILADVRENTERMVKDIGAINSVINNNNSPTVIFNTENHFNLTGTTAPEVLNQIQTELDRTFEGMALNAYQRSMKN